MGLSNGLGDLPQEISEAMTGSGSATLFSGLKVAVEVAVHISPLALLHNINYARFSMDRRLLLKVSFQAWYISIPGAD